MNINRNIVKRGLVYLIGLFFMAFGVSISKFSNLGVSPVNSIPSVLSEITKIDMGICTTFIFIIFVFVQLLILRKDFKLIYFLQIVCSVIFGFFVTVTNQISLIALPECGSYVVQLIYVLISIILIAIGILLYLEANILSLPGEGVYLAISKKTGIDLGTTKIIFDWTVIIIAGMLSIIFMGELIGVREGTIIAAFGVGICVKQLRNIIIKPVQDFMKNQEEQEEEQGLHNTEI